LIVELSARRCGGRKFVGSKNGLSKLLSIEWMENKGNIIGPAIAIGDGGVASAPFLDGAKWQADSTGFAGYALIHSKLWNMSGLRWRDGVTTSDVNLLLSA